MSAEFHRRFENFGLTEHETLWYRVSDERFRQILHDPQSSVKRVELSTNNYGEFLFVTVDRSTDATAICITFFGLGLHEQRDRWIAGEWFWYQSDASLSAKRESIPLDKVIEAIEARTHDIAPYVAQQNQSREGRFFETIADLTDDDSATTEIEDLGGITGLTDYQ